MNVSYYLILDYKKKHGLFLNLATGQTIVVNMKHLNSFLCKTLKVISQLKIKYLTF